MPSPTIEVFREDAYAQHIDAQVVMAGAGAFVVDRTIFYPAAGGQPCDFGTVAAGSELRIVEVGKDDAGLIWHRLDAPKPVPAEGSSVTLNLDWNRRYRLMRMHSCLHLLCKAVDAPVTGGQIAPDRGRLDFAVETGGFDKAQINQQLNAWIAEDRPIRHSWIDADELERRTDLVRTMSVSPPKGDGRVRLVEIEGVDLQACGGTHVRSTSEIGPVEIGKIENKGKQNRRFNVRFVE